METPEDTTDVVPPADPEDAVFTADDPAPAAPIVTVNNCPART
jgi:hypothetical protein